LIRMKIWGKLHEDW